jgi:putative transposase
MARIARVVVPGIPHHVTQRGNRRQKVFFSDDDFKLYLELMAEWCKKSLTAVWAYCLMPNHIHLIAVPDNEKSLHTGISEAHRRFSRAINFKKGWRGHLWQGRFASYPMDENYLFQAARYIELNPVRAGLVDRPGDYPWSSAASHINKKNDILIDYKPLVEKIDSWNDFLNEAISKDTREKLQKHERTGRPLGNKHFLDKLENITGRNLKPRKPGPKKKEPGSTSQLKLF